MPGGRERKPTYTGQLSSWPDQTDLQRNMQKRKRLDSGTATANRWGQDSSCRPVSDIAPGVASVYCGFHQEPKECENVPGLLVGLKLSE